VPIQHLTAGIRYQRSEQERIYSEAEPEFDEPADYNEVLLKILHSPTSPPGSMSTDTTIPRSWAAP